MSENDGIKRFLQPGALSYNYLTGEMTPEFRAFLRDESIRNLKALGVDMSAFEDDADE